MRPRIGDEAQDRREEGGQEGQKEGGSGGSGGSEKRRRRRRAIPAVGLLSLSCCKLRYPCLIRSLCQILNTRWEAGAIITDETKQD